TSHVTFRFKLFLSNKQRRNREIRKWINIKEGNLLRYLSKLSLSRDTKLRL
uniref:Uncharacterized protein n=1 Tax=Oryctolagus cuniculus TaxID=9986 RepID=A0A5F9D7V0_RABIT